MNIGKSGIYNRRRFCIVAEDEKYFHLFNDAVLISSHKEYVEVLEDKEDKLYHMVQRAYSLKDISSCGGVCYYDESVNIYPKSYDILGEHNGKYLLLNRLSIDLYHWCDKDKVKLYNWDNMYIMLMVQAIQNSPQEFMPWKKEIKF